MTYLMSKYRFILRDESPTELSWWILFGQHTGDIFNRHAGKELTWWSEIRPASLKEEVCSSHQSL